MSDETPKKPAGPPKQSPRDIQRAEALRANLMRRKAQARGRDDVEPKPEGDA